jgi:hypothetical protein
VQSELTCAENANSYEINIAAQPLARFLTGLSNQTETLVLFPYCLVESRQGKAVKGQDTLAQAIKM